MDTNKLLLVMERKPTSSGGVKKIVGGEIYSANLLELTIANVFWIMLLLLPIVLVYVFLRRGHKIPSPVSTLLRLIPTMVRVFI
jgi:hypothetical protein